ncbi:hypothetical protein BG910_09480 [Neisseria chenwenguii]|uniref:Uncharacterized protein n=1 Tax=Neisseria chenwenguii TaxID=1853278 RepID=A0A220S354_9NEIS|nr:hypothetical protein BG910_09480 [Neisseria chenwenguii]ROV56213.1 hypothetical protein EGS38_05665 [Neisseria chenwenguii]
MKKSIQAETLKKGKRPSEIFTVAQAGPNPAYMTVSNVFSDGLKNFSRPESSSPSLLHKRERFAYAAIPKHWERQASAFPAERNFRQALHYACLKIKFLNF